jgi:hypothetical protein
MAANFIKAAVRFTAFRRAPARYEGNKNGSPQLAQILGNFRQSGAISIQHNSINTLRSCRR